MASLQTTILAFRSRSLALHQWHSERLSWNRHTSTQTVANHKTLKRAPRIVSTLTPEKMVSAGQEIVDFSNIVGIALTTRSGKVRLRFGRKTPFPPRTTGVVYFHHIPGRYLDSDIRIRLCESVKHFARGSDLLVEGGEPWNITLHRMQPAKLTYQPMLDIIEEEFGAMPDLEFKYLAKTLLPDEMVSAGQPVFDISGRKSFTCHIRHIGSHNNFEYHSHLPFPPNTRGVLYSALDSTELRFRLCSRVGDFHAGSDLLLPAGRPWVCKRIDLSNTAGNRISTLVPQNIISSGQKVINRNLTSSIVVGVLNSGDFCEPILQKVQFKGFSREDVSNGIFYYHHVPGDDEQSQLRFRICSSVAEFASGEDATGASGATWNCSLRRLRKGPTVYQPILDLIREEYRVPDSGPDIRSGKDRPLSSSRRKSPGINNPISTLVPENIISSGQNVINRNPGSTIVVGVLDHGASAEPFLGRVQLRRFSPKNVSDGVFYYHHVPGDDKKSQLRFRQCSTTAEFTNGEDARGKRGEIWNVPLWILKMSPTYQPLLTLIQKEYDLTDKRHRSDRPKPLPPTVAQNISQEAPDLKKWILSLAPRNVVSSGQKIVDIGAASSVLVWVFNRNSPGDASAQRIQIKGFSLKQRYRGVFYYHNVPGDDKKSQLRFRLCSTIAEFAEGKDAVRHGGAIWSLPLLNLSKSLRYRPIFNLIREEFGVSAGGLEAPSIVSLSPRKLVRLKQQTLDISGRSDVSFNVAPAAKGKHKCIMVKGPTPASDGVPFPPETVGVFYYKQSLTSPTRIGELRFRLCRDLALFDHSEDLAFPTGDPWHIDVQQLCINEQYRALREILVREGLVAQNLHLADPINLPLCAQEDNALVVADVSQPFALELSREEHAFWVQAGTNNWVLLRIKGLFSPRKQSNNAYMGRVVARFEPCPQDTDSPSYTEEKRPLFALRFLEVLAPIQRISDEDFMTRPVPGQLHMVASPSRGDGAPREYRPWGFRNSNPENRKLLLSFVKHTAVKES